MPVPTLITDLSTTAANNYPGGGDSPANLDDVQRAHAAFIAQLATGAGFASPIPVTQGGTGRATGTTAYALKATGTTATGAEQSLAAGATTEILVGGGAAALPVWTTATGTGAPVRATNAALVTPNLGTPSALVGTNISGAGVNFAAGSLASANWTITEVAGVLTFKYGGVAKMSLDSSGNLKALANVSAYTTP